MVHLVEICWTRVVGGKIGRLSLPLLTQSTLTALGLQIWNCKLMENTKQSRRTQNTPRNPQQPGDCDHLDTARDETRPTR